MSRINVEFHVGHSRLRPGATGAGKIGDKSEFLTEYDVMSGFASHLLDQYLNSEYCEKFDVSIHHRNRFGYSGSIFEMLSRARSTETVAIELHCNAVPLELKGRGISGSELIVASNEGDPLTEALDRVRERIHLQFLQGLASRGIKEINIFDNGGRFVYKDPGGKYAGKFKFPERCLAMIWEACFIDNGRDISEFLNNIKQRAKRLLDAVYASIEKEWRILK